MLLAGCTDQSPTPSQNEKLNPTSTPSLNTMPFTSTPDSKPQLTEKSDDNGGFVHLYLYLSANGAAVVTESGSNGTSIKNPTTRISVSSLDGHGVAVPYPYEFGGAPITEDNNAIIPVKDLENGGVKICAEQRQNLFTWAQAATSCITVNGYNDIINPPPTPTKK